MCERELKVLSDYVMRGCCDLVCPGTKFCSRLQSFVLRGSAECRWDRGEWRRMDFIPIGGKEIESGFVLSLYLRNDEWTRTIVEGNASWFQRLLGKDDIKGSYKDSTSAELNRSGGRDGREEFHLTRGYEPQQS